MGASFIQALRQEMVQKWTYTYSGTPVVVTRSKPLWKLSLVSTGRPHGHWCDAIVVLVLQSRNSWRAERTMRGLVCLWFRLYLVSL